MCADLLGGRKWSLPIGAFSAFLLLPNNNIGTYLMAHPITQSLLLMPLILYLVALYISEKEGFGGKLTVITPIGILLSLALVSLIFIHPQGALNILAILLTISGIQFISKQFSTGTNIASYRTLYGPSAVLLGAFSLWAPRFPRVSSMVDKVLTIISEGSLPGGDITQRSGSLDALGADITELFLKMFFVPTIFCLIAGIFIVAWYFDLFDKRYSIRKTLLAYIIVSLAPLSIAFGIFFASSLSIQYFRYMGFIMVPITIIGAIAISMSAERLRPKFDDTKIAIGLVILFLVLFPLPIATMHGSPFIYQPNGGVSEMELSGTEHTVNYMEEDTPFTGVRRGPRRQLDATQGTVGAEQLGISGERVAIPPAVFGSNMTTHYDSPRYIPVSEADYQREVVLYDGFRYSKDGFRQLRTGTGINRVHTNGEYQLYLLDNQTRP